uniref:glycosyltransferase n=1 Tax=Agathobacter rectalis TaxID=39491 RepID=UPI004029283F
MVYMLFDNPADKQNMTFLNSYETAKIRQVYPSQKCNSTKEMLDACKDIIKQSVDGDTIIFWYDFMAVLCWWLCKVQFKNRKIIALNILLKDKTTAKNKLAKFLYKSMLKSKKVQATVTSRKYGEHLNEMLGISKQYTLLHDIYHGGYSIEYEGKVIPNTVFCGGRNGRDWEFLIRIAQAMPEITFNCVMTKDKYEEHKENFGKNMVVRSDIPEQEFIEFMCQSQLVVTPLDTEAPAGLIAFYQAVANGKMAITSDTVTTQEYFADGRGALCGKNVEDWKNKIRYYLQHSEEADSCAAKFKNFLEIECSEEKYAKTLWRMPAE